MLVTTYKRFAFKVLLLWNLPALFLMIGAFNVVSYVSA